LFATSLVHPTQRARFKCVAVCLTRTRFAKRSIYQHKQTQNTTSLTACHYSNDTFQTEQYSRATRLLNEALQLTERQHVVARRLDAGVARALRASTLNNLGILHRSCGRLRSAWRYCNKALRIELALKASGGGGGNKRRSEHATSSAGTHLNLCAILSQMRRHTAAILHAECALNALSGDMHRLDDAYFRRAAAAAASVAVDDDTSVGDSERDAATVSLAAIALHNLAVEQDFLRRRKACIRTWRRGEAFATCHLGARHAVTKQMHAARIGEFLGVFKERHLPISYTHSYLFH
jgi:tetratricopeptide (TPR) repeat protein